MFASVRPDRSCGRNATAPLAPDGRDQGAAVAYLTPNPGWPCNVAGAGGVQEGRAGR